MKINKLIKQASVNNHEVNALKDNSKKVELNDIFYAILGKNDDGNKYISEAVNKGAKTIVTENKNVSTISGINFIYVQNIRKKLAIDASVFYKKYLNKVKIIGVTGTNGKTTTTTLIYRMLRFLNIKASLIGTNGIYINDDYEHSENTTPGILDIYDIIVKSVNKGIKYVIIEVSSQAIKMFRIHNIKFDIALLTNITHDHLDFHKSFIEYMYVKGLFLMQSKKVIINKDILEYKFYYNLINNEIVPFGISNSADIYNYMISDINMSNNRSSFKITINDKNFFIDTNFVAIYNIYNITSALIIINELKLFNENLIDFLKCLETIPGRMEKFEYNKKIIIVDYAHSPDSLEKTLIYLNSIKNGNIISVFGAGGNRDKTKRPIMGEIASRLSDSVIITVDNSRDESPKKIIDNIVKGCKKENYHIILDRRKAIKSAIDMALENDIIVIFGRGNETYMIEGKNKLLINDIDEVKKYIKGVE